MQARQGRIARGGPVLELGAGTGPVTEALIETGCPMDQIVADEMKIDAKTYRGVVEAVETAVPSPALAVTSAKGMPPSSDRAPTPLQERLSSAKTLNEKLLAPHREEIQKLIPIVRNPLNLPR